MKQLTMMIGLPRSGKSTWVEEHKSNSVVISADKFRILMYGQRFYADGEPMVWAVREICLKILMDQGVDIILDETNNNKAARAKAINLAKKYGYEVHAIEISTPIATCKFRAMETSQQDLVPIIDKMNSQYEYPSYEEGFTTVKLL